MALLDSETKTAIDITTETEVLNYVYSGDTPIEVYGRVQLGNGVNLIAGNGNYSIRIYLNTVLVVPISDVSIPSGVTKAIVCSKPIMIEAGETVSIKVVGQAGDTTVNTVSSLREATPARANDIYGIGAVLVDEDYGGSGNLIYTVDSVGIDNACIHCFLKSDYDAGNRANSYIVARSTTKAGGLWERPMMLDPAIYTLVFFKQNITGPDTQEITVT